MVFIGKKWYEMHKNPIEESTLTEIIVQCECGTHSFRISSYDDENEVLVDIWSSNFYNKQKEPFYLRFWNKLKLIWFAICGKEYRLEDFVLSNGDVIKLIDALQDIQKTKQEVKQ